MNLDENLEIDNTAGKALVEMAILTATTPEAKEAVIALLKKSLFQAMDLLTDVQKHIAKAREEIETTPPKGDVVN